MIIGFGAKARQGKDTAADALVHYYACLGVPIRKINFADALKREVSDVIANNVWDKPHFLPAWVMPDPNPDMTDPLCPYGKHGRLLQFWGTDYRRAQDKDYWVKKWAKEVDACKGIVVTSDVRFKNEVRAISERNGYTCKVTRLDQDGFVYQDLTRDSQHASETELDFHDWDFHITVHSGETELIGEMAILISEYIREGEELDVDY